MLNKRRWTAAATTLRAISRWLPGLALVAGLGGGLSANAGELLASLQLGKADTVLRGDAKCTACHDETNDNGPRVLSIGKTKHGTAADGRTPTCTSCHGESAAHMKKPEGAAKRPAPDRVFGKNSATLPSEQNESCLGCHKGGNQSHWSGSQHASHDVSCTTCHQMHTQHDKVRDKRTQAEVCYSCHKTERALSHRMSTHPLDSGKMSCSDCHNPHGSIGPKLMIKSSVTETCYTCHTEKRGPFLWEHSPVVEDCMNCHTPHGSTNAPLLKARAPWLCEQCHQGTGTGHYGYYDANYLPSGAAVTASGANNTAATNPINPLTGLRVSQTSPNARLAYRGCVNCHSQIHGSNHPAGSRFVR
ncbi:MAG: DmsE family decaheme c-type cytochrome [Gallionellaceae bacterium]|nr:DmsE family decaheme c-type cytochrome [Gallionellaceae bacterium]